MKPGIRTTSLILTLCVLGLLSAATVFIYRQMLDRITLISANDNERILNTLLAGLRDHENFGSTIESSEFLTARVSGIAVYSENGDSLYSWHTVPERFSPEGIESWKTESNGRYLVPGKKTQSFTFIVRTSQMAPPPPHENPLGGSRNQDGANPSGLKRPASFFFDVLGKGEWLYIDIRHPDYWRSLTFMHIVFPLSGLLFAFLAFFVQSLVIRNRDYRDRIEKQKNLVVLGTAASTLAHEIKNPLLAIRLQTGILKKMFPDNGVQELDIINAEIDRLSSLTYRINDYLREPKGYPEKIDAARFVYEVAFPLCPAAGALPEKTESMFINIDRERFRSVLENVVRNALESGSPEDAIGIGITRVNGMVRISVYDRGKGISPADSSRLFEPFFTTKSQGTGIGLVICQRFVMAAGGRLEIKPREGGGTSVHIFIPESEASA